MTATIDFIEKIKKTLNIGLTRYDKLQRLKASQKLVDSLDEYVAFLCSFPLGDRQKLMKYLTHSKAQIRQDLFVLHQLDYKKNGFFVEFGATNGLDQSNTYLLEKEFSWSGILAEPGQFWHKSLHQNRNANIETSCVWSESKDCIEFNDVPNAALSTIHSYGDLDIHKDARKAGSLRKVRAISLNDLLKKYNAPRVIDYLSIDTEGSEYDILKNFDFDSYVFRVITCEHNFTNTRDDIFKLLSQHKYKRVFEEISGFDDWYVREEN